MAKFCGIFTLFLAATDKAFSLSLPSLSLPETFPSPSQAFTTASGLPVCRYALGGAARSTQPSTLPLIYYEALKSDDDEFPHGAPFYFYYNPHRYPAFMSGIQELCSESTRQNLFVVSGGTERGFASMEQRLDDALEKCGGKYLDAFILEYVCSYEMDDDKPGSSLERAIRQATEWKEQGIVRYVGASTHSHRVGAILAEDDRIDTLMLRYGMSHRDAAERLSFPASVRNNHKPVLAFTTTRWNSLQDGHLDWNDNPPTHGDCISFALAHRPPAEVVLHSARDEEELKDALNGIREDLSSEELQKWRAFGALNWNDRDGFDEYPEERVLSEEATG